MEDILLFFTNSQNNSKYTLTQLFYYKTINICFKFATFVVPHSPISFSQKWLGVGGGILQKHYITFCGLDFILILEFCTENSSYCSLKDTTNYAYGYVS
jgi:hypothetical protein